MTGFIQNVEVNWLGLLYKIVVVLNFRKASVVVKHSGLDESGDSSASNEFDLPISTKGHHEITRLPKGRNLQIASMLLHI